MGPPLFSSLSSDETSLLLYLKTEKNKTDQDKITIILWWRMLLITMGTKSRMRGENEKTKKKKKKT